MKKLVLLFLSALFIGSTACGSTAEPPSGGKDDYASFQPPENAQISVQYCYDVKLDTLDDIMRYSTNVVEATLISSGSFDGFINVYVFDVDRDFTENTPDEIHMYDAYNEGYVIGHTYYLLLQGTDSALYPHTIYTTVKKDLIIDTASSEEIVISDRGGEMSTVKAASAETAILNAVEDGIVGEQLEASLRISTSSSAADVSSEADVIAEIRVSDECSHNMYASTYSVELVDLLKGPEGSVASSMNLPPELDPDLSYYVFLKEDPTYAGEYLLFSRAHPVMEVSESSTNALSLE